MGQMVAGPTSVVRCQTLFNYNQQIIKKFNLLEQVGQVP
jgi:hypothetical protein